MKNVTDLFSVSMDGDFYLGVISSTWTAPNGSFDIDCYEVSILKNGIQIMMFNTTLTSMTATYTAKVGDTACARITVISKCGMRSGTVETNEVSPQLSGSKSDIVCAEYRRNCVWSNGVNSRPLAMRL